MSAIPFAAEFDLDIPHALVTQLIAAFEKVAVGLLSQDNINALTGKRQGVYQLFHHEKLVYVGKAENLRKRLDEHLHKVMGRQGINSADMGFRCLYINRNWTATAPEETLIRHYRSQGLAEWNGLGFGPHDPGREREGTKPKEDSFDKKFPIQVDWPCDFIEARTWTVLELLVALKSNLPFNLRYATDPGKDGSDKSAHFTKGHSEFKGKHVQVPRAGMTARELLRLVTGVLPGWQATAFFGYITLYRESKDYPHGTKL